MLTPIHKQLSPGYPVPALASVLTLLMLAPLWALPIPTQSVYVQGDWTPENNPYRFSETVIVDEGDALVIHPGVEVIMEANASFEVYGLLRAIGGSDNPIIFHGGRTGDEWGGIHFAPGSDPFCTVRYSQLDDCYSGISIEENDLDTLYGNRITARTVAIECNSASPIIENNTLQVIDNRFTSVIHCIAVNDNSSPTIVDNPLIECHSLNDGTAYGILVRESAAKRISGNWIIATTGADIACGIGAINSDTMDINHNVVIASSLQNQLGFLAKGSRDIALANNDIILSSSAPNGTGIYLSDGSNFTIVNNIVIGNGASDGIFAMPWQVSDISGYNDLYMNRAPSQGQWKGLNIYEDPRFVSTDIRYKDSIAYRLEDRSPCIDNGSPLTERDPDSSYADIGCFFFDKRGEATMSRPSLPATAELLSAYPNPFNSTTNFTFSLAKSGATRVTITDLNGRVLTARDLGVLSQGNHRFEWNASGYPAGIYTAIVINGDTRKMTRVVLLP